MTRNDILALERYYAANLQREANKRRSSSPAAAEQLARFAEASERRVEAIRCGPLFDDAARVREGERV